MNANTFSFLGEESHEPDDELIDEYYSQLSAIIEQSEDGYCFTIENEDEEQVAESCCYDSEEEAEEAADEKRYEIAYEIAQREVNE